MKIISTFNPPNLFLWLSRNLPSSLRAMAVPQGYWQCHCIYNVSHAPSRLSNILGQNKGDPIAEIYGTEISLYHPQYFSDFEDLLRRFEAETGCETTLRYWDADKAKRQSA